MSARHRFQDKPVHCKSKQTIFFKKCLKEGNCDKQEIYKPEFAIVSQNKLRAFSINFKLKKCFSMLQLHKLKKE